MRGNRGKKLDGGRSKKNIHKREQAGAAKLVGGSG